MTTQTVELDPATGLAALPEGLIWRVASTDRYLTLRLVETRTDIRYRAKWWIFGSEEYTVITVDEVMEDYFDTHQYIPARRTKENIADSLAKLSERMYAAWKTKQGNWDLMKSFAGDYPPKNLNSV